METSKLTLSIPKKILLEAKAYSHKTRQPLSRLVSRYFSLLGKNMKAKKGEGPITPRVKQVTGLAKSGKSDENLLFDALTQKYR